MSVRYTGGTGFVLGKVTKTNYGHKRAGDTFPMFTTDYEADTQNFEVINPSV